MTTENELLVADIPGYEGLYQVTNDGRIFSKKRAKFLKFDDNGNGYKFVFLYKNNIREKVYIHRVVAEAFCIKENETYNEIHHIDGDTSNNAASNLMWVDEIEHIRAHKSKPVEQYDLISGKTIAEYKSGTEAFNATGIYKSSISSCCNGKRKAAGGYGWRFKDNNRGND